MRILMLDSDEWRKLDTKAISQRAIEAVITKAATKAAEILGDVSGKLNIIVKPGLPHIRKEIGVGGSTYDPELLDITFDVSLPFGPEKLKDYLYQTVFHEINHALRYKLVKPEDSLPCDVINEGLAVVFERDYANATRRPKTYDEAAMRKAYKDMLNPGNNNSAWFFKHAYEVGPWIVDQAIQRSSLSAIELTGKNVEQILELAQLA